MIRINLLLLLFSFQSLAMNQEHSNSFKIKASYYDIASDELIKYPEDINQANILMKEINQGDFDTKARISKGMHKSYIVMRLINAMKVAIEEFHNKKVWAYDKLNYEIYKIKEEYSLYKTKINEKDLYLFRDNKNKIEAINNNIKDVIKYSNLDKKKDNLIKLIEELKNQNFSKNHYLIEILDKIEKLAKKLNTEEIYRKAEQQTEKYLKLEVEKNKNDLNKEKINLKDQYEKNKININDKFKKQEKNIRKTCDIRINDIYNTIEIYKEHIKNFSETKINQEEQLKTVEQKYKIAEEIRQTEEKKILKLVSNREIIHKIYMESLKQEFQKIILNLNIKFEAQQGYFTNSEQTISEGLNDIINNLENNEEKEIKCLKQKIEKLRQELESLQKNKDIIINNIEENNKKINNFEKEIFNKENDIEKEIENLDQNIKKNQESLELEQKKLDESYKINCSNLSDNYNLKDQRLINNKKFIIEDFKKQFSKNIYFELEQLHLDLKYTYINLDNEKSTDDLIKLTEKLNENILYNYKNQQNVTININEELHISQQKKSRGINSNLVTAKGGGSYYSDTSSRTLISGGGQSFAKIWDQITKTTTVPKSKDFIVGNLLKEFDLSIPGPDKKEGSISFGAGLSISPELGKMWVQMTTSVRPSNKQLKREPFNIVFLVDISGSMKTGDFGGDKRYKAVIEFLEKLLETELQEGDQLEVLLFDVDVKTYIPSMKINEDNKTELIKKIKEIKTGDWRTNLEKGLDEAFKAVKSSKNSFSKNAIIVISDADTNEGGDLYKMKNLVDTNAKEGYPIIVIGMGSGEKGSTGFNEDLVYTITHSRGCSYDFLKSKDDLLRVIPKIKYLLSPLFYDVKVSFSEVSGVSVSNIYGSSHNENEKVKRNQNILEIKTLSLAPKGTSGGALIIEYDIKGILPSFYKNHIYDSCTYSQTGEEYAKVGTKEHNYSLYSYYCDDCNKNEKHSFCFHCAEKCHGNHKTLKRAQQTTGFYCDCPEGKKCSIYVESDKNKQVHSEFYNDVVNNTPYYYDDEQDFTENISNNNNNNTPTLKNLCERHKKSHKSHLDNTFYYPDLNCPLCDDN